VSVPRQERAGTGVMIDPHALLPHRFPLLMLDRIEVLEPGRLVRGVKTVTGAEWAVVGAAGTGGVHAMPHLLIVEALAQLSAGIFVELLQGSSGAIGYFMGIDNVRFRSQAEPGDLLELQIELRHYRRSICKTHGAARVDGRLIVEADLTTVLRAAPVSP
jgi:3-hydroxyacyl-[acyl-carrier-protein] dehydratase